MPKNLRKTNYMFIRKNFRLYPNKEQSAFLNQDIGNQRFVWNLFLHKNEELYDSTKTFLFFKDTASHLKQLKSDFSFLSLGNSQALQQTLKDQDTALKNSFKKTGKRFGFPRFKKKVFGGSVRYPQHCFIEENKLFVPKVKEGISIAGESVPTEFNSVTIKKTCTGKWFVSFVVPFTPPEKVTEITSSVGIDLNSKKLVVLSNGTVIHNPKFFEQKEQRLKRYQRIFSRKQKGSKNKNKFRFKVARVYEKITNTQKDFIEKVTTTIAKTYDHISIEDLNVKAMQKFNGRMILMAPFRFFRDKMTWKANKFGKHLSVIDRFIPTTKVCSGCGQVLHLSLKDRWVSCDCGLEIDRDYNAAINIHRAGTAQINAFRVA